MEQIEYDEMFTSLSRYFGDVKGSIIKNVSKRAQQMANTLKETKGEDEYPTMASLDESIAFKKDTSKSLWKTYDPVKVERDWDEWWVQNKYFHADAEKAIGQGPEQKFVICQPPPNVTGYLHAGHALTGAVEDCMSRWNRMSGKSVLYVPGVDHAGIATQMVVEKQLQKKGLSRHDLGREKFVEEVYKWKDHSCERISKQLKKMGMSLDWDRFVFTMDEPRCKSVTEAFIRLKESGLIYRANRLVNWSCTLNSAISNIEVEKITLDKPTKIKVPGYEKLIEFGVLVEFAYKVKGTDRELVVATTRIETMLGDVAVAVHPDDERYKDLIGKELEHPFIPDRKMIVVADGVLVDMAFGTGAVKVTPAHDENDFECGKRNGLEFINIMNDDGTLNHNAGPYSGMKRYDVRYKIMEDLEKLKLYKGKKANPMALGTCSRSNDIIEPLLKPQWYVKMTDELKEFMLESVRTDEMHIVPEVYKNVWNGWVKNLEDWCISRQLWWGHRIPAYLVQLKGSETADESNSENWICGRNLEEATSNAEKKFNTTKDNFTLIQDEDVLDTWFSSALFPFAVLGWPDNTADMKAFFPNTILETGHDILFFWVAKMVIMSYYLQDKQLPYKKVFLHSMVRDENGEKMSKSKGNVIDPLEIIDGCDLESILQKITDSTLSDKEKQKSLVHKKKQFPLGIPQCGADTLRFGLLNFMHHGKDLNLDVNILITIRQFCNKIWNTFKFVLMNLGDNYQFDASHIQVGKLRLADKWILTELNNSVKQINEFMAGFQYHEATEAFQDLWQEKFCNIYLEYSKTTVKDPEFEQVTKAILFHIIETGLKLLHPMMPFLSEELYQKLPSFAGKSESICIAPYPKHNPEHMFEGTEKFLDILAILGEVRSVIGTVTITGKGRPDVYISVSESDKESTKLVQNFSGLIALLAKANTVSVVAVDKVPANCFSALVKGTYTVNLDLIKLIDVSQEITKIKKLIQEKDKLIQQIDKKRAVPSYAEKAPQEVKDEDNSKYGQALQEKALIEATLQKFTSIKN